MSDTDQSSTTDFHLMTCYNFTMLVWSPWERQRKCLILPEAGWWLFLILGKITSGAERLLSKIKCKTFLKQFYRCLILWHSRNLFSQICKVIERSMLRISLNWVHICLPQNPRHWIAQVKASLSKVKALTCTLWGRAESFTNSKASHTPSDIFCSAYRLSEKYLTDSLIHTNCADGRIPPSRVLYWTTAVSGCKNNRTAAYFWQLSPSPFNFSIKECWAGAN